MERKVKIPGNIENAKLKTLESRSHDISNENTTIQELEGEKLTPFDDFGDIFACSDLKHIRIIVQLPLPATTAELSVPQEPRKEIRFPTAVGTPGKGKTTFARRAYEKSDIYSGVIGFDVVDAVDECQKAHRIFRIACDNISGAMYSANDHESLFGKVLLYEALKYRMNFSLNEFIKMLGSNVTLETILKVILYYIPCLDGQIEYPLFIININETNALFESGHGTHASDLFETVKSSNTKTEDISLPLLKFEHAEEVLLELANQGVVDEPKRINKLSEHTKYAIKLLGVVGRFLEAMIFQMSVVGSSVENNKDTYNISKFYQKGLRYYLENCQYESKYCDELLKRTKKHINEKYQRYFDHFQSKDNLELIPHLVAYSLFEWPVERSDTIGIKNKRKIEDLEKEELIFLEGNEYNKRIKLPFFTLHEIYSNQTNHKLPSIRILDSLDNAISPNQNEKLTISLVPLRNGQKDISIKFLPTQTTPECIAYYNMQNAEFADSSLITEPFILIQDKQLIVSHRKVINGYSATMLEKGLVEKEHNKCKNVGEHIFLFVTNSKKRNDETYKENEILITEEESNNVFGDLLVLRKLHCIEG
ncbi:hypothetical protein C2G38_2181489 [Gigaspora rosea]|uniref:Uncharacterized protein n=1 Tax=Gigaspora rosea TaxID=44941 RepID=A0A397VAP9_9GLOM|nr:hypothetical protein C2G38_2181489 [Gigaspora rosea]